MPSEPIVTKYSLTDAQKRKVRILVAEDNIVNQQVALHILEKFGFRADAVANGYETLKALEMVPYDLVLMDVQMPEMDGFEATSQIRRGQSAVGNRDMPIIAMTAHAMKGDRQRCLEAGMNDYIAKPIEPQKLLEKIETWVAIEQGAPGADKQAGAPSGSQGKGLNSAPIDLDKAIARAMGDRAFLKEMLDQFLASASNQIEEMVAAFAQQEAEVLKEKAHALKGAAFNLNAETIAALAQHLEHMGRNGNLSAGKQVIKELNAEIQRLQTYVGQIDWQALSS